MISALKHIASQAKQQARRGKTHIRPTTTQINNLRTPIPILLQTCALETVESVRDSLATAHHTLVLVVAEAALVADAHQRRWPHVGVAHGTLAVAFVAEPADGNAGLLAAHYEVTGRERIVLVGGGKVGEGRGGSL